MKYLFLSLANKESILEIFMKEDDFCLYKVVIHGKTSKEIKMLVDTSSTSYF